MTDHPSAAPARVPFIAIAALVVSTVTLLVTLATVVFYGGQMSQRIADTVEKQIKFEARAEARMDRTENESREQGKQFAAVQAKLDLMLARMSLRP